MTVFGWCLILVYISVLTAGFGLAFSGFLRGGFRKHSEASVRTACGLILLVLGTASGITTLIVAVASSGGNTQVESTKTNRHEADQSPKTPAVWERHTTPDSRCSAEFPERPHTFGNSLRLEPVGRAYTLACEDIPPDWVGMSNEAIFDVLRDHFIHNAGHEPNELVLEARSVINGVPCSEWEFCSPEQLKTRLKVFIRDGKIFQAGAINGFSQYDADRKRFTDSFQFE